MKLCSYMNIYKQIIRKASVAFLSIYLCKLLIRNKTFLKSSSSLEFAASSTTHELITPISASSFCGTPCAKRDFVYAGIYNDKQKKQKKNEWHFNDSCNVCCMKAINEGLISCCMQKAVFLDFNNFMNLHNWLSILCTFFYLALMSFCSY